MYRSGCSKLFIWCKSHFYCNDVHQKGKEGSKKSARRCPLDGGAALCFRIGGAEDKFIFYIEYCFFFVPVMKLRREYNISKQFQSISCLTVWLRAHFPPSKMLIWGKISIFDTKNLISRYFTTFQLPNHLHLQKMSKIQLYSYGKIQAKQIWLLKYTKTCPKLAVLGYFLIFFCFWCQFFENFEPEICFVVHQMLDKISQMTDICQKCT